MSLQKNDINFLFAAILQTSYQESSKNELLRNYEMIKPAVRRKDLIYPELSYEIIGCAYEVFKELGYGHTERTYQKAMSVLFADKKWSFQEQIYIPVVFKNTIIEKRILDFIIDNKIVVELKKDFHFSKAHIDQVLNYLKLSKMKLALLINFGKEGVMHKRIINAF